jgi:hypothetical protein
LIIYIEGEENMKEKMLYKLLVVGLIVLFVGIGIQPAIAVVEPEFEIEIDPKEYLFQTIIDIANNPEAQSYFYEHKQDLNSNYDDNEIFKNIIQKILSEKPNLIKIIFTTKPDMSPEYFEKMYNIGLEIEEIIGKEESLKLLEYLKKFYSKSIVEMENIILNDVKLSYGISKLEELNRDFTIICMIIYYLSLPIALMLYIVFEPYFVFMFIQIVKIFMGGEISENEAILFLLGILMAPIILVTIRIIEAPFVILFTIFDCWDIVPEYPWYDN